MRGPCCDAVSQTGWQMAFQCSDGPVLGGSGEGVGRARREIVDAGDGFVGVEPVGLGEKRG